MAQARAFFGHPCPSTLVGHHQDIITNYADTARDGTRIENLEGLILYVQFICPKDKIFFWFKAIYMSSEELKEIKNFCGLDCLEEYREEKTQRKRRNDGEKEK